MVNAEKKKVAIYAVIVAAIILIFTLVIILVPKNGLYRDLSYGFEAKLPAGLKEDRTFAEDYIEFKGGKTSVKISRETVFGSIAEKYCDYYLDRFIDSEYWRNMNGITLLEQIKNEDYKLTALDIGKRPEGWYGTYVYLTIYADYDIFYRVLFRSTDSYSAIKGSVTEFLDTFRFFTPVGSPESSFRAVKTDTGRSSEAASLLSDIEKSFAFGIYTDNAEGKGIDETIPSIEDRTGYTFEIVLDYVHLGTAFPAEYMEKARSAGKTVELTYQITDCNNEKLYDRSALLSVWRGEYDEEIREFARAAAGFGHPFLFRLNNEMNSDWTSYSGVVNLCDPEIYTGAWRRIHDIFDEEGATNAIWIFNPNDIDYPPCCWNTFTAYFPGEKYVDMIGLTGYNTGTYYADVTGEKWRTFSEIYTGLTAEYKAVFKGYDWIITEFACSGYGGDKSEWITDMFARIKDYPDIKAAVWFSSCDYDYREGKEGIPSRTYRIDETEETLNAFAEGIRTLKQR